MVRVIGQGSWGKGFSQGVATHLRWLQRSTRESLARAGGSQLLELALVLPILLVLAIGGADFGGAYNLKQKLNNAAREGARIAASSPPNDISCGGSPCSSTPSSITAIRNAVANYLGSANVAYCTISTSGSQSGAAPTWTYALSGTGCSGSGYGLTIQRQYQFSSGTNTVLASQVTLSFPYTWTIGRVIGLIGGSFPNAIAITSNSIMPNLQ